MQHSPGGRGLPRVALVTITTVEGSQIQQKMPGEVSLFFFPTSANCSSIQLQGWACSPITHTYTQCIHGWPHGEQCQAWYQAWYSSPGSEDWHSLVEQSIPSLSWFTANHTFTSPSNRGWDLKTIQHPRASYTVIVSNIGLSQCRSPAQGQDQPEAHYQIARIHSIAAHTHSQKTEVP